MCDASIDPRNVAETPPLLQPSKGCFRFRWFSSMKDRIAGSFKEVAMSANQSSEPVYKVTTERNLPMRARDGVTLYADVYRPDAPGKFPVLVCRTPYDKSQE